ncbi:MAG: hypothetical protein FJ207_11610 [Gemmatimonadetes bacterium]|nr:hypothetical protein [Gemmatimonadota bacterium]
MSRQLAGLAVAQQRGPLTHRQREELRRALATAGEALGWSDTRAGSEDPVAAAMLDVIALTNCGVDSLEQELAEERVRKQTEIARLEETVAYARELAGNGRSIYPAEITYSYTARDSFQRLVTKTATSTVSDPSEALGIAVALQKSIESRTKLTDLMVVDLQERRASLRDMKRSVPDFAKFSRELLSEVIANLA